MGVHSRPERLKLKASDSTRVHRRPARSTGNGSQLGSQAAAKLNCPRMGRSEHTPNLKRSTTRSLAPVFLGSLRWRMVQSVCPWRLLSFVALGPMCEVQCEVSGGQDATTETRHVK